MVIEEQSTVAKQIVRYGLPLVIVIFYVTASLSFDYTPESTFLFLQDVRGVSSQGAGSASPSPLWHFLVTVGGWMSLDALLTVKVLSLLFGSFAVLCAYLFSVEAISDTIAALFVALCVAVEPWLLQLGPSGSAMSLGLTLSLATLYFVRRGDNHVAALFAALGSLVFWQGIGLFFVVAAEMIVGRGAGKQSVKLMAAAALMYLTIVSLWIIYAIVYNAPVLPALVDFGDFPALSPWEVVVLVILGGMVVGLVVLAKLVGYVRDLVQTNIGGWVWVLWLSLVAALGHGDIARMAIPVLLAYAFLGLKSLLIVARRGHLFYTAALALSVVVLLVSQTQFSSVTRPLMRNWVDESRVLEVAASWLRGTADVEATVAAEKPGIVAFYSARKTLSVGMNGMTKTDFVVTAAPRVDGYDVAYAPVRGDSGAEKGLQSSIAVWKRR